MYYLRGSNITFDDYNFTDVNYTNFTSVHNAPIFVSWLVWLLSWIYL